MSQCSDCWNKPWTSSFLSSGQRGPSLSICRLARWIIFTPRQQIGAPGTSTGSGGHLTKHNPCGPVGSKQQLYIMLEAIHHSSCSIQSSRFEICSNLQLLRDEVVSGAYSTFPSKVGRCTQKCQEVKHHHTHLTGITLLVSLWLFF